MKKLLLLLPVVSLLFSVRTIAQGEGNFWFFGSNAGLDFNSGAPVAITVGALTTGEGCAAISDPAGNLLFYTDGITVWNKLHSPMPDGTGLFGDGSSTQSGIIVPKPGSPDIYYIFTTTYQGMPAGLCYSEVDMTLDGGLGDVTATKNIPLHTPVTEKLTAVKNADGVDIWVIAHDFTSADFLVYAVTSAGVTTTPITSTTGTIDDSGFGIGYLKASTDGRKLAAALDFKNIVDVLDFDASAGTVSWDFSITPVFTNPYGVEFSPDGKRLYVASESSHDIYQYDMTSGSSTTIIASATVISTGTSWAGHGAIQNAPDKKMYVANWGGTTLDRITDPDSLGSSCHYVMDGLDLAGEYSTGGLPNFITSFFRGSPFDFVHICVGDSTFFTLVDTAGIDSIQWNFGDPVSGSKNVAYTDSVYHVFPDVGSYTVTLITSKGSVFDTATSVVEILGVPRIFIGNDTSICAGDSITLNAGRGYTYLWQDGSTQQTFRAPAGGTYYVAATGLCATGRDTIHITAIPLPVVTVTNDTICVGQTAHLTAHGANSYTWSSGATAIDSTAISNPVVTTTYMVTGTTGFCFSKATATIKVNPLPFVTSTSASICIGNEATLVAAGAVSYHWSTGAATDSLTIIPTTTTTYTVTGTSAAGCVDSATATVTVVTPPVIILSPDASIVAGTSTALSATGGTAYNWSPSNGLSCTDCPAPIADPLQTTTYCVVVSNTLCSAIACLMVNVQEPCPDITELGVPDAFSPNNDGSNDLFLLQGWNGCITEFNIVIYDRWGEKVFESNDVGFSWDGIYRGRKLDPAVFIYCIRAKLASGTDIDRKGNITLIK